jgi:hypothetical protein
MCGEIYCHKNIVRDISQGCEEVIDWSTITI